MKSRARKELASFNLDSSSLPKKKRIDQHDNNLVHDEKESLVKPFFQSQVKGGNGCLVDNTENFEESVMNAKGEVVMETEMNSDGTSSMVPAKRWAYTFFHYRKLYNELKKGVDVPPVNDFVFTEASISWSALDRGFRKLWSVSDPHSFERHVQNDNFFKSDVVLTNIRNFAYLHEEKWEAKILAERLNFEPLLLDAQGKRTDRTQKDVDLDVYYAAQPKIRFEELDIKEKKKEHDRMIRQEQERESRRQSAQNVAELKIKIQKAALKYQQKIIADHQEAICKIQSTLHPSSESTRMFQNGELVSLIIDEVNETIVIIKSYEKNDEGMWGYTFHRFFARDADSGDEYKDDVIVPAENFKKLLK